MTPRLTTSDPALCDDSLILHKRDDGIYDMTVHHDPTCDTYKRMRETT